MNISARHYARLGAVQFLYWWNFKNDAIDESDEQCLIDYKVLLHGDAAYLQKLIRSIPPRIPRINKLLGSAMNRKINAVDPVERAILQLGVYELTYQMDVPPKVVTNECIELSREFGNPDSYRFINGTLDKIAFGGSSLRKSRNTKPKRAKFNREFELIEKHFNRTNDHGDHVVAGIGDDCAVVEVPRGQHLVVSTDSLLQDVHFPKDTPPEHVGYKSLAVSLSDLASMGAEPAFATLNISMPNDNDSWLEDFSRGFFELADQYGVSLIGGDTVRGPLNIAVTAYGFAKSDECIFRNMAREGDGVFVTGTLGDAALGLVGSQQKLNITKIEAEYFRSRLDRPKARIEAGIALRNYATSAIDISDGLISDLSRILQASGVGADVKLNKIPISATYRKLLNTVGWDYALAYGDDYELCFTLPENKMEHVQELMIKAKVAVSQIGTIRRQPGLAILNAEGEVYQPHRTGYSHF